MKRKYKLPTLHFTMPWFTHHGKKKCEHSIVKQVQVIKFSGLDFLIFFISFVHFLGSLTEQQPQYNNDSPSSESAEPKLKTTRKARRTNSTRNAITALQVDLILPQHNFGPSLTTVFNPFKQKDQSKALQIHKAMVQCPLRNTASLYIPEAEKRRECETNCPLLGLADIEMPGKQTVGSKKSYWVFFTPYLFLLFCCWVFPGVKIRLKDELNFACSITSLLAHRPPKYNCKDWREKIKEEDRERIGENYFMDKVKKPSARALP